MSKVFASIHIENPGELDLEDVEDETVGQCVLVGGEGMIGFESYEAVNELIRKLSAILEYGRKQGMVH